MRDTSSGKRWARSGLGLGAGLSVIGNVAHAVLLISPVSLWLRIPFAVVWPVALFVGIEVLVRIDWRQKFIDYAGRFLLVGPVSVVAAVVSYLHLHSLMVLASEDTFSAIIGPAAVDGLMIGCTVALLAVRSASLADTGQEILRLEALAQTQETETLERTEQERIASEFVAELETLPETPEPERAPRTRTPRGDVSQEQKQAMTELLAGKRAAEIECVSRATATRINRVIRILRNNPHTMIDCKAEKVHPALVDMIRGEVRMEAAR